MSDIELYGSFSLKYAVTQGSLPTELSRNMLHAPAECGAFSGPVSGRYKSNAYYFFPQKLYYNYNEI